MNWSDDANERIDQAISAHPDVMARHILKFHFDRLREQLNRCRDLASRDRYPDETGR